MKNKGFTLVELLAVIVVLVIIALIATPIVRGVIRNARKGAAERSTEGYLSAVETTIARQAVKGITVSDGLYMVDSNGNLTGNGKTYTIEVNGDIPLEGSTVAIEDYQVIPTGTNIKMGDYIVTINDSGKATANSLNDNGLMNLLYCDLQKGYTANTVGAKYLCDLGGESRYFYVLEAGTSSKLATLLLAENYDNKTLAWCISWSDNSCNADNLEAKLDEIKETKWTKLDRDQIDIPSAEQIAVADELDEDAYLDSPFLTNNWLFGGASYWTSTPHAGKFDNAWVVYSNGRMSDGGGVNNVVSHGIRPVITIPLVNMSL